MEVWCSGDSRRKPKLLHLVYHESHFEPLSSSWWEISMYSSFDETWAVNFSYCALKWVLHISRSQFKSHRTSCTCMIYGTSFGHYIFNQQCSLAGWLSFAVKGFWTLLYNIYIYDCVFTTLNFAVGLGGWIIYQHKHKIAYTDTIYLWEIKKI
jgi:hypothetical protein